MRASNKLLRLMHYPRERGYDDTGFALIGGEFTGTRFGQRFLERIVVRK